MAKSASPLHLKTAMRANGQNAPIKEGKIPIDGVVMDYEEVHPQILAYRRMVRNLDFDVCELASTTYFIARAYGIKFKALPIFFERRFHHHGLLVRPDAGIREPKDLEGKKVGVRAYSVTTGVWTRGILINEYGMDNSKVTWVVDDEEHVTQLKLPPNVVHVPQGKSLASMMASGEIQAGFAANAGIGREGPPKAGWEAKERPQAANYAELIPDYESLEADFYKKTHIYPCHGVLVVKESVLDENPWLPRAMYEAFVEAKKPYLQRLMSGQGETPTEKRYRRQAEIVGGDPVPYGIEANRPTIEALVKYGMQQGLIPKKMEISELFADPER